MGTETKMTSRSHCVAGLEHGPITSVTRLGVGSPWDVLQARGIP